MSKQLTLTIRELETDPNGTPWITGCTPRYGCWHVNGKWRNGTIRRYTSAFEEVWLDGAKRPLIATRCYQPVRTLVDYSGKGSHPEVMETR